MSHENPDSRPARPANAPPYPPPSEGRSTPAVPIVAALPVGVRDGDVLIVPLAEDVDMEGAALVRGRLRDALGDVRVVFIPGGTGCTVLRPERSADSGRACEVCGNRIKVIDGRLQHTTAVVCSAYGPEA